LQAAKDLDSRLHHIPDGDIDPVKSAILPLGPVSVKRGIACFGEAPSGPGDVCTFIARSRTAPYVDRYDDQSLEEAPRMSCSRTRQLRGRAWG